MNFQNKIFPFVFFTIVYNVLLSVQSALAVDNNNAGPAQPNLVDSSNYIVVFKPDIPSIKIKNQIQKMKMHQVNNKIDKHNSTTAYTNNSNTTSFINNTTTTTTNKINNKNMEYNSIGKFRWYSAKFNTAAFENLLESNAGNGSITEDNNDDAVHYWVKDATFSLQNFVQTNPPSWGLDRIDQRTGLDGTYKFPTASGDGVTIYLMDSGINENHTDIAGRVKIGKTVVGDPNDSSDLNGHGTFVAGVCCGTRYGVAKKAEIVSVKTLDNDGNGQLSNVLVGLQWIVQQHLSNPNAKSIVNLSLGAHYSQATNDAVEQAMALGIHFSIAAGNYGEDACKYSPGSTPGAITVGAIDKDDSVSYYSNFGKCVDIFAPGTDILSIWPTSNTATKTLTGTSMAAPHVAGTMAIFLSQENYTPPQLSSYIKRVSSLISEDFTINNTGVFYNENKTIIDNAIDTGYKVKERMGQKTLVNILYNHPADGRENWIYGQSLSQATSSSFVSYLLPTLIFIATLIVL